MVRFLKFIVLAPFALLFLAFAFANRHSVTVAFDPISGGDIPAFSITAPLFVTLIIAVIFGIALGSSATWLAQGKYRRAARQNRAEAERFRAQALASAAPPATGALSLTRGP